VVAEVQDVWWDSHRCRLVEVDSASCLPGWEFPRVLVASSGCRPTQASLLEQAGSWLHQAVGCYLQYCPARCSDGHRRSPEPAGPWEIPCHHLASRDAPRFQTKVGFAASEPEGECCPPTGDSSEVQGVTCHPPWDALRLPLHDPSKALLRHRRHLVDPAPAPAGRRESPPKGPAPGPCYSRQILTIS